MRAGDTLYLPRGWLHQAMTSDTASLHLTVGINVATWRDAVRDALDEAAEEDVAVPARRGCGRGGSRTGSSRRSPRGSRPKRSRGGSAESFVEGRRPIRGDAFDQLRALEAPRFGDGARAQGDA